MNKVFTRSIIKCYGCSMNSQVCQIGSRKGIGCRLKCRV
jgi:hypothetical protein